MQSQNIPASPLLAGLRNLSHAEKLRVISWLLREVAAEEGISLESEKIEPAMATTETKPLQNFNFAKSQKLLANLPGSLSDTLIQERSPRRIR